ncbi:MAG: sodium-independent anion transporter [Mycobacteriales bacterium]
MRSYRIAAGVLVLELLGGLDLDTAPLLEGAVASRVGPLDSPSHVEVDLEGLTFLDTSGLDALQAAVASLESAGVTVTVAGARRQVRRLLGIAAAHGWLASGPMLLVGAQA